MERRELPAEEAEGETTQAREILSALQMRAETIAQTPVTDALQSADLPVRREASHAAQTLLATLKMVEQQKRSVEETMALLLQEVHAAREQRRESFIRAILWIGLLLLLGISAFKGQMGNLWWLFWIGGGTWATEKAVQVRRDAADKLSEANDSRAVGVLALTLRDGDAVVRRVAENALQKLLPRVRASDAAYISSEQMTALLDIAYREDTPLKLALLKALEQIGDERAIPAIKHLLDDPADDVHEKAQACLPFVQERVRRATESMTLLRASSAQAAAPPDQLLRAASPTLSETPAGQLLRPVEREKG